MVDTCVRWLLEQDSSAILVKPIYFTPLVEPKVICRDKSFMKNTINKYLTALACSALTDGNSYMFCVQFSHWFCSSLQSQFEFCISPAFDGVEILSRASILRLTKLLSTFRFTFTWHWSCMKNLFLAISSQSATTAKIIRKHGGFNPH